MGRNKAEGSVQIKIPRLREDQYRIASSSARFVPVSNGRRWGKALDINTPIPTPDGFIPMGAIRVGDSVYDEQGKITRVTFVSEIMYDHPCYEVKFMESASIVADADHLWQVYDVTLHRYGIHTTRELAQRLMVSPGRYSVMATEYIQGGTALKVNVTDAYRAGEPMPEAWLYSSLETRVNIMLQLEALSNEILQRRRYYARPRKYIELAFQDDHGLVDQVMQLICTLGFTPQKKRFKIPSGNFTAITFERSRLWCNTPEAYRYERRFYPRWHIEEIIPVQSRPVRCIQVDSPSHLYLAGKQYIPTHNTTMGLGIVLANAAMGARCAWVVPTYKNGRPLWKMLIDACMPAIERGLIRVSQQERTIQFVDNKGWVGIYTATNENSIRGEAFHVVVLDEAALISETTWTDVILPTLADTDGKAFLISTPRGRGNWFYREWQKGWVTPSKDREEDYMSFQAPSSDNPNPNIKKAAERAKLSSSDRTYRQEWLGEFVEDGGAVFQFVRRQAIAEQQGLPKQGHQYIIGCDWGRVNDYSVFAVYDVTEGAIVNIKRYRALNYVDQQLPFLENLYNLFNPIGVVAEVNGVGRPLVDHLQSKGFPVIEFTMSLTTKNVLVELIAVGLETGSLRIINDTVLIDELEAFEIRKLPSGRVTYSAPMSQHSHDDTVIAVGLALWGAKGEMHDTAFMQAGIVGRVESAGTYPKQFSNPGYYRKSFRSRGVME